MTNAPMIDGTPDVEMSTSSCDHSQIVAEAIAVIDRALSQMVKRELVSSAEVSDLLLDVRNLLSTPARTTP